MSDPLAKIADAIVTRSVAKCPDCGPLNGKWKPCTYHRGYLGGIVAMINQINVELESVGFDG
jgi:hypothetical protein